MRHNVSGRNFSRPKKERDALLKSLMQDVILHGRIRTTEAKAKEIRPMIERILTISSQQNERLAIRAFQAIFSQEETSRKLLTDVKARVGARTSGLVRIRRVGVRSGDGAPLVQIELT